MLKVILQDIKASAIDRLDGKPIRMYEKRTLRQMRMKRPFYVDLLSTLCSPFDNLQVSCESLSPLIIHYSRSFITYPRMRSSSPRINPHNVLETKIFSQSRINNLYSHSHERPALMTDIGLAATGTYLVVIGQIYIENQLLCHRTECGSLAQRFSVSRICGVYWTYFKTGRIET